MQVLHLQKNLAFIANGSFIENGNSIHSNDLFKQQLVEGGIGYFTKVGKNKRQVLEVYAGYGIGKSHDEDRRASMTGMEPVDVRKMDFDKIFLQVNYSSTKKDKLNLFGKKRALSYGTAIRVSRIAMTDFTINDITATKEEALFIEPLFFYTNGA